jgi:hypothetical protein
VGTLLAERIDRVNGVIVGQVTGSHTFNTTANSKKVLSSTFTTYTSASTTLVNTHKEYAADEATDVLYHGRAYADIASDGTQVSYVQQRGTWNGSTFTAGSTGTAWREARITGVASTQSGTSLLSTYLSQTIQPIYVKAQSSTITIRIHKDGNLVREELHVCSTGTTFEKVSQIDREYVATGELKKETRYDPASTQSVVLYDSTVSVRWRTT